MIIRWIHSNGRCFTVLLLTKDALGLLVLELRHSSGRRVILPTNHIIAAASKAVPLIVIRVPLLEALLIQMLLLVWHRGDRAAQLGLLDISELRADLGHPGGLV